MALDGITVANIVSDLNKKMVGGRVTKIIQPEKDELILTIKNYDQFLLALSADASLPFAYITEVKKEAPLNSPAFCMLLRKHLQNARITGVSQPGLERIINIDLEHLDEMGDMCAKRLVIELMGKHSNIIFCDMSGRIIDSIKRVPSSVSSVREVLPGREYFIPQTTDKLNPLECSFETFEGRVLAEGAGTKGGLSTAIYTSYTGISPVIANEICFRAGIDPDAYPPSLNEAERLHLYGTFERLIGEVKEGSFRPCVILRAGVPAEFASVRLEGLLSQDDTAVREFDDISSVLSYFYASRSVVTRIRQRSADLRKIVANCIERTSRKYDLQLRQLKDTEKRDKYKLYGELLTTYGYSLEAGIKEAVLNNYYTGEDERIPLDPDLSAIDNAKKYFDKYSKLKRTFEALTGFSAESAAELEHLRSISMALDIAEHEEDLIAIRDELAECGYIKSHARRSDAGNRKSVKGRITGSGKGKSGRSISIPFHYVTSDGFHIYVGKNNYQNDELTFKFANGSDWWFHAKGIPGSHVILKTEGRDIPDRVFELAAGAAAYYSAGRDSEKLEIDYLERKNVKKPAGAKPGFVVYYTNYSMIAIPGLEGLEPV